MRAKLSWIVLIGVIVSIVWLLYSHRPVDNPPSKIAVTVPAKTNELIVAPSRTVTLGTNIVVQTGQERMSNAVRCMSYTVDLSSELPKECASAKPLIMALAGVLYYSDCLMAKMTNGRITITTNELQQAFSNALVQLNMGADVPNDLVQGFNRSFLERDSRRITLDEKYKLLLQQPDLAGTLNALDAAIKRAGVADAAQSDIKEIMLMLGSSRTTAYLMYGSAPAVALENWIQPNMDPKKLGAEVHNVKNGSIQAYVSIAAPLENMLKWRLTNMYGLDEPTAQSLVLEWRRVPVSGFDFSALQVPYQFQ